MGYADKVLELGPAAYWRLNEKWPVEDPSPPTMFWDSGPGGYHADIIMISSIDNDFFGQPSLLPFPDTNASTILGPIELGMMS